MPLNLRRGSFPNDHANADSWYVAAGKLNDYADSNDSLLSQTINAGHINYAAATFEASINLAIADAISQGAKRVRVPAYMIPHDATLINYNVLVQMVREGGNDSVYEPESYGAAGDDTRNDVDNVQVCIDSAATRGTVVLNKKFRCETPITIPSFSEIVGLGWQSGLHFTWISSADGEVYLINANNTSGGNTNIRLRDFTLTGAHPGGPSGNPVPPPAGGILFRLGSAVEVRNLQIEFVPGISLAHQGIDRFVAAFNYVHDAGRDGITGGPLGVWPSTDVKIHSNTILHCHDDFICANQSVDSANPGTSPPTGWSIRGNVCTGDPALTAGNFSRGITLSGAVDCAVSGNEIHVTNSQGIYVLADVVTAARCSKIRVVDNTVSGAGTAGTDTGQGRSGIYIIGVDNIQIQDNTVTGCAENGIFVFDATEFQIQNNSLDGNGATAGTDGMGIYLNGNSTTTTDGLVTGNKVRRSKAGGIYAPNCNRIKLFNNECYNNGQSGTNTTLCGGLIVEGSLTSGKYWVHDNVCEDTQGTKTQVGGINTLGAVALAYLSLYNNYTVNNKTGNYFFNNVPTIWERRGNQLSAGASKGRAALVNGTVTVSTAEVVTADNIQLTRVVAAGTTRGVLTVGTIVNATSFVIRSEDLAGALSADDDSTVFWEIVH